MYAHFSAVQCITEKKSKMINIILQAILRCIFPHLPNMDSLICVW